MPVITITKGQARGRFGPPVGRYAPMKGSGGRYLLRLTDYRIVTQSNDVLTDSEVAELRNLWVANRPEAANRAPIDNGRAWVDAAIDRELSKLTTLAGDNPHKPDSEFWKSLLRLAGVVKGEGKPYFRPSEVLEKILRFAPHDCKWKGERDRDIVYLWSRAMNRAPARYREQRRIYAGIYP